MRLLTLLLSIAATVATSLPLGTNLSAAGQAVTGTTLRRLRVLTWDINAGRSASGSAGIDAQLDAIWDARPDIVALQNVTPGTPALIQTGLETRSSRAWSGNFRSNTDDPASDGVIVLTPLPLDTVSITRLPGGGAPTASAAAVGVQLTVNSFPVFVGTARLDPADAVNRAAQLQQLQQWLAGQTARQVMAGDFGAEPSETLWTSWRTAYQDAWQVLVFNVTQEWGWTVDVRPSSGKPARTDYHWYAQLNPTEVFLLKSAMSSHHAVVADYEVR